MCSGRGREFIQGRKHTHCPQPWPHAYYRPPVAVEEEMVSATFIDSFDAAILIASSASGRETEKGRQRQRQRERARARERAKERESERKSEGERESARKREREREREKEKEKEREKERERERERERKRERDPGLTSSCFFRFCPCAWTRYPRPKQHMRMA